MATVSAPNERTKVSALFAYRTIDLVTVATLGVASGVVFWAWSQAWNGISTLTLFAAPPLLGLLVGPWLIAGVLGGLVVRKPGAALAAELIGAAVEMLIGNQWGTSTLVSGLLQGLGVEVVLALVLYKRFGVVVAALGGALAGAFEIFYEWHSYYSAWTWNYKLAYLGCTMLSGAILAGVVGWILVRALAATGVLDAFGAGREHHARNAV
ncbi:MAG TPA: ECF transporter S component [Flexivirga sp.]|uniref:ECF transporter S component n=1 Tax=Flexivirga sp. TaxID=1962927 RepID=UPI002C49F135|nr:ECF transporter S component [Flexivirga sp.]HWC20807.1 ECF transporter S component [Flexivirga sp.]